ncbi:hypothetical protein BJ138DRAFT_1008461 [Hygrophoropsis aurantiaca]|uniref:Uncharacterized protein n=1 Tax=Hygrophoropsis aurantiaca TaxID=72124 RepID=A0ACB8AC07_9AGAM|nr:hypothetical protein BJ138DRAFT_1008461 [Hygrophoropsis aurantiaca]
MAGHNVHRHKVKRIVLIVFLLIAAGLARQLLMKTQSQPILSPAGVQKHQSNRIRIEGRWREVRASLGLPPLPDTIDRRLASLPHPNKITARFDLRRKRAEATLHHPPDLYLASDTKDTPVMSLQSLAHSFHEIAQAEKELAIIQARLRHEKQEQKLQTQLESRAPEA